MFSGRSGEAHGKRFISLTQTCVSLAVLRTDEASHRYLCISALQGLLLHHRKEIQDQICVKLQWHYNVCSQNFTIISCAK